MARIHVCDPTAEAPFLIEQLRQAGFGVTEIDLEEVPTSDADLVLLAGDLEGSLSALKRLRDDEQRGGVPVVLVGAPEGAAIRGDGPAFGADAVFARPVELDPFLRRVRVLLSTSGAIELSHVDVPKMERTLQLTDPDDPDSSQVLVREEDSGEEPVFSPREPTMQLDAPSAERAAGEVSKITSGRAVSDRAGSDQARSDRTGSDVSVSEHGSNREGAGRSKERGSGELRAKTPGGTPITSDHVSEPEIPADERAELSPWLAELLAAADRRVFPERPALALHFPAADEPPEELVPRELFDAPAFGIDEPVVEDPIDAFTYVGGPAVPPPVLSGGAEESVTDAGSGRSVPGPSTRAEERRLSGHREQTTATEAPLAEESAPGSGVHPAHLVPMSEMRGGDWPEDDTVLGREAADGTRRGALGPGGAIRLLWRLAALGLDAICEVRDERDESVRLTFLAGEVRAVDGDVATRALAELRRRGRATERPADEVGAQRVLSRRVEAGELGRFERERLLRHAREALLADVVAADRAEFALTRFEDTEPGRVLVGARALSRPLRAALVDAARRGVSQERAIELLGGLSVGLALGERRESALSAAELPSELVDLLSRMEGRPLRDLLAEAPTERGLAAALYALVAGDALRITEAEPARDPEARRSVRQLVTTLADLAADGHYFEILGVAPDADTIEVERAFEARRDELLALPLELLGLESLADPRDRALDAVEEARRALAQDERRRAYARALGL